MGIAEYNISKIITEYKEKGINELANEYNLTYKDMRTLLNANGVKIKRGRKRGSGVGKCTETSTPVDRRTKWQNKMIEEGRCTSCGGPNKSESMYHCDKCLKARTEAKKKK